MIIKLNIADLNVRTDTESEAAADFCNGFRYDFRCEPDVHISVDHKDVKAAIAVFGGFKTDEVEKLLILRAFGEKFASCGGVLLKGQLTGASTGKYALTLCSGGSGYYAIRKNKEGKNIVYSTPWSDDRPFQGELFSIEIADQGIGESLSEKEWIKTAIHESVTPLSDENFGELIGVLGGLFREINVSVKN